MADVAGAVETVWTRLDAQQPNLLSSIESNSLGIVGPVGSRLRFTLDRATDVN